MLAAAAAVIAAIITGLFSMAGVWFQYRRNERNLVIAKKEELTRVRALGFTLSRAARTIGCDRALLIRAEDSGDIRGEGPKFITIVDEHFTGILPSLIDEFDRFAVDTAYKSQILEPLLNTRGRYLIKTEDLEDGFLKSLYQTVGVEASWVMHIHDTEAKLWFVSFNFQTMPDATNPVILNKLDLTKHRLYAIISEHPEVAS